jgi:hypothetical protein
MCLTANEALEWVLSRFQLPAGSVEVVDWVVVDILGFLLGVGADFLGVYADYGPLLPDTIS